MQTSPVVIFTYRKVEPLKHTIKALQNNFLAKESDLFIFSDGFKNDQDAPDVEHVRNYLKTISGFKSITIKEARKNTGLAASIINGVTEILGLYGKIIVLEDDLITSPNFLNWMNQALDHFKNETSVHSISGFTVPMNLLPGYIFDNYVTKRASSWGWATWINRWDKVDWEVQDYGAFSKNSRAKREFNKMGSDMSAMLRKQMEGKINSWAIRWCFHQFKEGQISIYPVVSKVTNIGFGEAATHTKGYEDRYRTRLDDGSKTSFNFDPKLQLKDHFIKQFTSTYSLKTRIYYKIKQLFHL